MQTIKWLIAGILCFTFNGVMHAEVNALHSSSANVINEIPPQGIVINAPGTYIFNKDIKWHPTGPGQAIKIVASNVVLDMQHHTLESDLTQFNTIGIMAAGAVNLTIKNGTIKNMALGGIKCEGCAYVLIKHICVDGLNIENIVNYTVPVGILVDLSAFAIVDHCKVKNLNVRTGSMAAIQMTATFSSTVSNCEVSNLKNKDGACTGIGHAACDVAVVSSCTIDGLKSEFVENLNTAGHTTIGIIPVGSFNLIIKDCKISNIVGCCDDAHGMSLFECAGAIVKKCHVENVLDGAGPEQTGAKATGIEIYASGVQVIKCSLKNIKAINPQDKQATGFSVAQCVGVKFIKCKAENVTVVDENGQHNPSLGYGTGFGWAPDPRSPFLAPATDIFYHHCKAKNCQVGFDSWYHIDSVWDHITSKCNGIAILNLNQPPRTISCDACSECNPPITITINNVATNNQFLDVKEKGCGG